MQAKRIQRVHSKWLKTRLLLANKQLESYIPDTRRYDKTSLQEMLNQYRMVYVKPDRGTFGMGVMRVEQDEHPNLRYRYQSGEKIRSFPSFKQLYSSMNGAKLRNRYLVQKGIHLLKHHGRRFDIRVMVQRSPVGKWEATGMIGRVAHPRKIVTNYHSGGKPMAVETLLKHHLSASEMNTLQQQLRKVGVQTAHQLAATYPRIKEIGLDIALDHQHHPWILEVNTKPDPYIFKKLQNRAIYRRVIRYARAYGGV